MNFLEKLNLRRLSKAMAIAAVSGSLVLSGNAVVNAAPANDGMWAFREAYTAQAPATRAFTQNFSLFSATFHLDMNSKAQVFSDGSMRMGGNLIWTYTNIPKNYSTNNTYPFYIEQVNNEMTFYVQRNGRWNKMLLPGLPAGIALMWKTTDPRMVQDNIDAVKAVEILRDDSDARVMRVTLDGSKVANILEKNSGVTFANVSGAELTEQQEMFKRWLAAFRTVDITFTWSVKKPTWETLNTSFDLTELMRAYSRHVLDESAAGRVVLSDEERNLLDAMGYYSELHAHTMSLDAKRTPPVTLPANVKNAPMNDNAIDDIFEEMTSVVKK